MPQMMLLGPGASKRWLGHKGRPLTNVISALIKETLGTPSPPPLAPYEDTKVGHLQPERVLSAEARHAGTLI